MACDPDAKADSSRCIVDCAHQPCKIEAYNDIGGIGVILGFAFTAWFVVVLLIVYYVTVYDYSLDTFRAKDDFETLTADPNPVDHAFLSSARKWLPLDYTRGPPETRKHINKEFNKCVVAFADLQIMTGIGILISGIRPTVCGLQAYHWQIIVHLAWFSSITHLSTLSFLRHYLINRPWQLYVRGALMGLLAALLGCAVYIAGHFDWDDQRNGREVTVRPSYFARCVLGQEMQVGTLSFESMVFDLLLITYGYTIRLVKVWRRASNWPIRLSKRLMKVSYERLREWDPCHGQQSAGCYLWTGVLEPVIIAVPRVIYLQINIFTSYLAEVFWVLFATVWRTVRLGRLMAEHRPKSENDWAFGQVLPLMLMAAPLILLCGPIAALWRAKRRRRRHKRQRTHELELASVTTRDQASLNVLPGSRAVSPSPGNRRDAPHEEQDITDIGTAAPAWTRSIDLEVSPNPGSIVRDGSPSDSALVPSLNMPSQEVTTTTTPRASSIRSADGSSNTVPSHAEDANSLFLKRSLAFQGSILIAVWPFVELAVYLLIGNRKGLRRPFSEHAFTLLVANPLLQVFWLVYTAWASRLPRRITHLHFSTYITLLAASVVQFKGGLVKSGMGIAILLGVYLVFAPWALFYTSGGGGRLRRLNSLWIRGVDPSHWVPRYLVSAILLGASLYQVTRKSWYVLIPLSFQFLAIVCRKGVVKVGRGCAFFVMIIMIVVIELQAWFSPSWEERGPITGFSTYPFFDSVVDYPLWAFAWAFIVALWPMARKVGLLP